MCGQVDLVDRTRSPSPKQFFTDDAIVQWMMVGPATVLDGPVRTDKARIEQSGEPGSQGRFLISVLRRPSPFTRGEGWRMSDDVCAHSLPEFVQLRIGRARNRIAHQPTCLAYAVRLVRALPNRWLFVNARRNS